MQDLKTDFIVVGGGVAGLRAAIELSRHGDVIVLTKDVLTEGSTEYAQGGVAVALNYDDEVAIHFEDTIKAGDGLCRHDAVNILVKEGPDRILELIDWGAEFDKEDSKLAFTIEAAHSRKRILHAKGDSTGKEIMRVLVDKIKTLKNVKKMSFNTAVDLIVQDNICYGVVVCKENSIFKILGRATIIATGGAGQVYSRTTNPDVCTGDGIAMALRAGAILEDMEFVQFHPTVLYAPNTPSFLLSEAMRGEGAIIRDVNGDAFMQRYHPKAELAPRDVVSRAIISQMVETKSDHVYLDLTHLNPEFLKKRFPRIYSTCLGYNLDITKQMVPISPAAHYLMGGIKTDIDGATNIKGLYSAGESACTGVHGANRLASNSLLEGLVFGFRCAVHASGLEPLNPTTVTDFDNAKETISRSDINTIRNHIKKTMWEYVGIIRCGKSLSQAKQEISRWKDIMDMPFRSRIGIETKNIICVAMAITESALCREGSVGAHYRTDFKERGENWQRHISVKLIDKEIKTCI
ncbi:MAG: L-aspartate oxidase [Thermodesulfovibrionales bacterium]|nr:L-aspartate oxidase [Thermodesulfovibrionales bacterium]